MNERAIDLADLRDALTGIDRQLLELVALAESGEAAPQLAKLSSTTFDAQLGIASRVAAENPHLYFEIQTLNEHGGAALGALKQAVQHFCALVESRDEAGFVTLMENGKRYLDTRRPAEILPAAERLELQSSRDPTEISPHEV